MAISDRPCISAINYDESGNALGNAICYSASPTSFTPGATPTDIAVIQGSATKTVRVSRMWLSTTQTSAGMNTWFIIKRSTADTSGTSSTATNVPYDSSSSAATASIKSYTANPTTGSVVGNLQTFKLLSPAAASAPGNVIYPIDFTNSGMSKGVTLRGTAESLCLNFNGAALPSGLSVNVTFEWSEE